MRWLFSILSLLPLKALYAVAQGVLYPLVYYVAHYRRKVVARNLRMAFPDKSDQWHKQMQKRFYHRFCDHMVEIIHLWRASEEQMLEHVQVLNQDELEAAALAHHGAIIMLGHYACWEYGSGFARRWKSPDVEMHAVYHRLHQKSADEAMKELREKHGLIPVERLVALRHFVRNSRDGKTHVYVMVSDQKPMKNDLDCRLPFLHTMTPFITGSDQLARKFNYPVFYVDIQVLAPCQHQVCFVPISLESKDAEPGFITAEFARLLEQNILRQPEEWLWSHNRFKYSTPLA